MTLSAGSVPRYSCRRSLRGLVSSSAALAMPGGAHRVAAELLAHHRHHPVREGVGVTAAEALVKGVRDDPGGDVLVDRGLDRPAALAGVLDVGGQAGQLGVLLEADR